MREVRWRELADKQYRQICREHQRFPEAVSGALRSIGYAGHNLTPVPNTGNALRQVDTVKGLRSPASVIFFTYDGDEDCYWIEEIHLT